MSPSEKMSHSAKRDLKIGPSVKIGIKPSFPDADKVSMIDLTRLNGNRLLINCDLIKFAEASPDTTLALITGEKIIVRETCDELAARIIAYRGRVLRGAWPDAASAISALGTRAPLPPERTPAARPQSWVE